MAKQVLDCGEGGAPSDNLCGEGVSHDMRSDLVGHSDLLTKLLEHPLDLAGGKMAMLLPREERGIESGAEVKPAVELEDLENGHLGGGIERDGAGFSALGDPSREIDFLAGPIENGVDDVFDVEPGSLTDSETGIHHEQNDEIVSLAPGASEVDSGEEPSGFGDG